MKHKITTYAVTGTVLLGSVLGASTAFAATDAQAAGTTGERPQGMMGRGHGERPAIIGTVTAITGTTITVTGKLDPRTSTAEGTYSVDAANATVTKSGSTSSVSAIAVGDTVMVAGTVSGTTITATAIHEGFGPKPGMRTDAQAKPAFVGNGQPVVGGTVTAVNGSTITITNKSNVTYTVDAGSATIITKGTTGALSDVTVGDALTVQGTVNGTSVVASSVLDEGTAPSNATASGSAQKSGHGFFGAIGGFFHSLFGFF